MRWEILDDRRIAILKALVGIPETDCFCLAGGTALSLQLGLRQSYDFDFFTGQRFNGDALLGELKGRWPGLRIIHVDRDTCDISIDAVQVSFMRYPYPLVSAPIAGDALIPGLKMYGPEDIAAMKLSAIGSRGARKDFYDLYQIYHTVPGFDSPRLLHCAHLKYGEGFDLTYMIAGMSFFEDAEGEVLPKVFIRADWEEIKAFFKKEQAVMFETESRRY